MSFGAVPFPPPRTFIRQQPRATPLPPTPTRSAGGRRAAVIVISPTVPLRDDRARSRAARGHGARTRAWVRAARCSREAAHSASFRHLAPGSARNPAVAEDILAAPLGSVVHRERERLQTPSLNSSVTTVGGHRAAACPGRLITARDTIVVAIPRLPRARALPCLGKRAVSLHLAQATVVPPSLGYLTALKYRDARIDPSLRARGSRRREPEQFSTEFS